MGKSAAPQIVRILSGNISELTGKSFAKHSEIICLHKLTPAKEDFKQEDSMENWNVSRKTSHPRCRDEAGGDRDAYRDCTLQVLENVAKSFDG